MVFAPMATKIRAIYPLPERFLATAAVITPTMMSPVSSSLTQALTSNVLSKLWRGQQIPNSVATRAVDLGREDATALSFGGFVLGYVGGDIEESAACIDQALVLNPNLAVAWGYSSWVKTCLGEPDKGVEHAARAMRLSPLDPRLFSWQFCTGLAYFCAGQYDHAVLWAERALRYRPGYASATRVAAASHALAGRPAEAQQMMARLREFNPALRLSNLADVLPPFRRPDDRNRYIEALRKAGLPE